MGPASSLFFRQDPAGSHPCRQTALVPAVLAILAGDQGDLTLPSTLGALEAVVVAGLHGTAEESATRRTNLPSIVAVLARPLSAHLAHQVLALLLVRPLTLRHFAL